MLSEYTLVARAMPDEHQELGTAICSVGLCPDKGLIRVYPLLAEVPMSQWRTYEVAIEKDASDTRIETWKPDLSFAPHEIANKKKDRYKLIGMMTKHWLAESIDDLNAEKRSLAVVIPERITGLEFRERKADERSSSYCKKMVSKQPRISYELGGKKHNQQLMEFGCYQWLVKQSGRPGNLWDNLGFYNKNFRHVFLVGNYRTHRNSWGIISVMQVSLNKWRSSNGPVLPFTKMESQKSFNTCSRKASV